MFLFHLIVWGPVIIAALLAVGIRFALMRDLPRLAARPSVTTILAGSLPALVFVALRLSSLNTPLVLDLMFRTVLPVVLGILSVLLLMIPVRSPRTPSTAQLTRRTIRSFLRPGWPIALILLTVMIAIISVSAGLASRRDELGRYTEYWIEIGTKGISAGTGIYGWHYSLPSMVAIAVLLAVTTAAWMLISRPAWGDDPERDASERRLHAANIGWTASAALLVHLAAVLQSLGGTASLAGTTSTSELGVVTAGTSFAAIGPALQWSGTLAFAAGLTLWFLVALSVVPVRLKRVSDPVLA